MTFTEKDKIEFEMAFFEDKPKFEPKDTRHAPLITSFSHAVGAMKAENGGDGDIDGIVIKFANSRGYNQTMLLSPTVAWRLAIAMAGIVGSKGWYPLSVDGGEAPAKN